MDRPGAQEWVPSTGGLRRLADAAQGCRGCELWAEATQVVFSRGPASAQIMLVGEQPGDQEDRSGEPFVGPAGKVLAQALDAAQISGKRVYLTNAVKHFRHTTRGRRRIHEKPAAGHITACHPWLEAELAAVRPEVVVCLGATAGRSVLGRPVRIGAERGALIHGLSEARAPVLITSHPSALLRIRDARERDEAFGQLVTDLRVAASATSDRG